MAGLTRYFTGEPCKHGHVAERMVSTATCVVCLKEKTKRWRKAHPEFDRKKAKARNQKDPAAGLARLKRWIVENPERAAVASQNWKERNPARAAAIRGLFYAERRCAAFPEDKDRSTIIQETLPVYAECVRLTRETGKAHHVDHIVPISKGGEHTLSNLQVLSAYENQKKGAYRLEVEEE